MASYLDKYTQHYQHTQQELEQLFRESLENPEASDAEKKCLFVLFLAKAKDEDGIPLATSVNNLMDWVKFGRFDSEGWFTLQEATPGGPQPFFDSGSNNSTIKGWLEEYIQSGDLEAVLAARRKGSQGLKPRHSYSKDELEQALAVETHPTAHNVIRAMIALVDFDFQCTTEQVKKASGMKISLCTRMIGEAAEAGDMPLDEFLERYRAQTRTPVQGKDVSKGGTYQFRLEPSGLEYITARFKIKGDETQADFFRRCVFDWTMAAEKEREDLAAQAEKWQEQFKGEDANPCATVRLAPVLAERLEKLRAVGESDSSLVLKSIAGMLLRYEAEAEEPAAA